MTKPLVLFALALVACGSTPAPPPEAAPGCNPIVGDDCLTPFPSAFFEPADTTTRTGVRVALTDALLPTSTKGSTLHATRFNARDGFSPSTPFLVYFKDGVDPASFAAAASWRSLDATVTRESPVQIIDASDGTRLPVFAELDVNAIAGDRQALLIHPMTRLRAGARYIVALVGLKDRAGQPLAPAPFRALRDRTTLSRSLQPLVARYETIFATLATAGVARPSLSLAWDVVTSSDETMTSHLRSMADAADQQPLAYTVTAATDTTTNASVLRELRGTFKVPWFLADASATSMLAVDDDGAPRATGVGDANFLLTIPRCAATATAPLPIVVYGHGLFQSAGELRYPWLEQLGNRLCMVLVATDWIGLAAADLGTILSKVLSDGNNIFIITDRLQQAHVNAQVLTRLVLEKLKDDPGLVVNGKPAIDGSQIYYLGVSDGGIQGNAYLALSRQVERGVLNVPGAEWSLMMFRSADFAGLKPLLEIQYPDPLDLQVLIAATQSEWDYTDAATFAPHVLGAPFPGRSPKRVLVQEAIGDAQVPNMATRVLVRALGVPGLALEQPVFGVVEKPAPLDSGYTQWNIHPSPLPPETNKPPLMDNQAHDGIRILDALQRQLLTFLRPDGTVQ